MISSSHRCFCLPTVLVSIGFQSNSFQSVSLGPFAVYVAGI
jgi:hypothetical protein